MGASSACRVVSPGLPMEPSPSRTVMKIVVIYKGSERDEPFEEIDGVWNSARHQIQVPLLVWFRTESKWTRKRTYVQILRSVCCLGVRLFFDDWAGSHNGPAPDHFLRTIGGRRIRIHATWLLQAADHHTHFALYNFCNH